MHIDMEIVVLNSAGDMRYSVSLLHMVPGDRITWTCISGPISISFLGTSPLEEGVQIRSVQLIGGLHTAVGTVSQGARPGAYHYLVAATKDGRVFLDAGCPEISILPPGGAAAAPTITPALPEGTIRRSTEIEYSADPKERHKGVLAFALKVQGSTASSAGVDIRVPQGMASATLVVHASSSQFEVSPKIQYIKVPRLGDSEVARFAVEASTEATGDVAVTIFDQYRLVGSLVVKLTAKVVDNALVLRKLEGEVFRDAGATPYVQDSGYTIQVSLADAADKHIQFHVIGSGGSGDEYFIPMGKSREGLSATPTERALASFRKDIETAANSLTNPEAAGFSSKTDLLKYLELTFKGLGRQILNDLISPEVQELIRNRLSKTVVHWVIKDSDLDVVPWEFAFQNFDASPANDPLLVRVPVWARRKEHGPGASAGAANPAGQSLRKIAYLLGKGVKREPLGKEIYENLSNVMRKADPANFKLSPNFSAKGINAVSVTTLGENISDASIVHVLCHGVVEKDGDMYLKLQDNVAGHVRPRDIYALQLSAKPLVFVNSCSSSAATFSVAGVTTFGKSFLEQGASVYIGTLAPVITETALSFATEFFDARLGDGLSIILAMKKVRQILATSPDPGWRLYTIYGDLSGVDL